MDNYPHEAIFLPAGHIFLDMKYQTCLNANLQLLLRTASINM